MKVLIIYADSPSTRVVTWVSIVLDHTLVTQAYCMVLVVVEQKLHQFQILSYPRGCESSEFELNLASLFQSLYYTLDFAVG